MVVAWNQIPNIFKLGLYEKMLMNFYRGLPDSLILSQKDIQKHLFMRCWLCVYV